MSDTENNAPPLAVEEKKPLSATNGETEGGGDTIGGEVDHKSPTTGKSASSDDSETKMEVDEKEEEKEAKDGKKEDEDGDGDDDDDDEDHEAMEEEPKQKPKSSKKDEDEDDDNSDDEDDDDAQDGPPEELQPGLLERPLVLEEGTKRQRKKVERIEVSAVASPREEKSFSVPEGRGVKLGDIPRIELQLQKTLATDLKLLHRLIYGRNGGPNEVKRNIRKFYGFSFEKDSAEYKKKILSLKSQTMVGLKMLCTTLDLERSGTKEAVMDRIVEFLLNPQDSGKPLPKPKRKRSVGGKGKGKKRKRKSKDEKDGKKKKARSPKKAAKSKEEVEDSDSDDDSDEDEKKDKDSDDECSDSGSDKDSSPESEQEESAEEEEPPKKKTKKVAPKKEAPKKEVPKKTTPKKPPAKKPKDKKETKKATPKKASPKKAATPKKKAPISTTDDSDDYTSEDEAPLLAKKEKKPPSDEELKDVIKKILDGANLEEITMKTVCRQVYEKYPDFDLTSRKDFIKTTVKQIIR